MNYEVVALGELLIDFVQDGQRDGVPVFAAKPGGAPCNVLAMLRRLGHTCAFLGKVGADAFGTQLRDTIRTQGIGDEGLISDPEAKTALAIVHNDERGERSFVFYRDPGADMLLRREELPGDLIENARIFHFGSLSLTHSCSA